MRRNAKPACRALTVRKRFTETHRENKAEHYFLCSLFFLIHTSPYKFVGCGDKIEPSQARYELLKTKSKLWWGTTSDAFRSLMKRHKPWKVFVFDIFFCTYYKTIYIFNRINNKFSIVIGSPRTHSSPNRARSHGCPITGGRFKLFVSGHLQLDTQVICMSITRTVMAFFAMFRTVFNIYEKRYRCFRSKELPKRHF